MSSSAESAGSGGKGLRSGALGLLGSVVLGTASVAPAYSLAASLGFIVAAGAGVKSPGIIVLAFVPMVCIAVAYKELNAADPDCGTTFAWGSRAFGPRTGWMGGWTIIVADVIVMANLAEIAGSYSFHLADELGLHNNLSDSTMATTLAGVVWIAVMTWICYRGIDVSAKVQNILLGVELATLLAFAVTAFVRIGTGRVPAGSARPSLGWLLPTGMSGGTLASALLVAVFIYWGWDTAVASNEETADPTRTPGRAALLSTVLLLVIYLLVSYAAIGYAGTGTTGIGLGNPANADDVFAAVGTSLFGNSILGRLGMMLLSISVLTSSALSTQTTILPTARTALSMAHHQAIPARFSRMSRYLSPSWATVGMGVASILFYLLMTAISPSILLALIGAIGLQIALYYGLTGLACVWYFRHTLTRSVSNFVMRGLLPMIGTLSLAAMLVVATVQYAQPDYQVDADGHNVTIFGVGAVAVVGIGAVVVGIIPMIIQHAVSPAFFTGRTIARSAVDRDGAAPLAAPLRQPVTVGADDGLAS